MQENMYIILNSIPGVPLQHLAPKYSIYFPKRTIKFYEDCAVPAEHFFYRKRLPQQNGDMRKRDLHAFKLYVEQGRLLSPPTLRPLPPTRDKRLAGPVLPAPPPPSTHALPMAKICDFQDLRPKVRTASI
jgi:hypothetical protein